MKVILKEDVKGLGKKESMVEVNDGYARNFLMPRGLAVEATSTNMNVMNTKKAAEKSKKDRELAKAKEIAGALEKITMVIKTKAGENGKLFGSITNKDLADKLRNEYKLDIEKKQILCDALKSLGAYTIEVRLYPEVTGKFTVKLES